MLSSVSNIKVHPFLRLRKGPPKIGWDLPPRSGLIVPLTVARTMPRVRKTQVKSYIPVMDYMARKGCETTRYADRILVMPRTNQDGKDLKLTMSWFSGRIVSDAEMADAVGIPTTNYSRRKDADDFPNFEELQRVAMYFRLNPLMLQVAFGLLDPSTVLLDEEGLRQYVEQGGGDIPTFPTRRGDGPVNNVNSGTSSRRRRRADAPPGP